MPRSLLSSADSGSTTSSGTPVQQNIYAQAAAFGMGAETALLLAVDCTGVPDDVVDPLSTLLSTDLGIAREKIVVSSTHSHSCPHVTGYLSNLFDPSLSPQRQSRVDQYTALLSQRAGDDYEVVDWLYGYVPTSTSEESEAAR